MIRAVAEPEARPQQQQQKQHTPAEKAPAAQATSSSPSSSTSSRRPPRTKRVRVFTSPLRALLLLGLFALLIGLASLVVPTTLWVEGGGFVMTDVDAELRPSVEGNIDKWLVSTGQLVEKDQLVIQLNGSIQQAEHEEASSELRAKEAELDQMLSAQELERAQRKEQVSRGEQNLKLAEAYLERMTGGGYSQKEVDEARLKMEIALSQLAELR
ncbi:MAG: hypothetical protein ACREIT_10470, partial [Tepidisphaeraceae bacterium]